MFAIARKDNERCSESVTMKILLSYLLLIKTWLIRILRGCPRESLFSLMELEFPILFPGNDRARQIYQAK